jgi:very-short-patch-repair endonuclease
VTRKDGHHPIIFMQCGPVRHTVDAKSEAIARPFRHSVFVRPTSFRPITEANSDMRLQFQDLYRELSINENRNHIICNDVMQCVKDGRSPLVLTECKEHLHLLAALLEPHIAQVVVLHGGTTVKENRATQEQLVAISEGEPRVLLATGRYVGEAFLFRRFETLDETVGRFRMNAALPIAFDGWGKMEVDFLDEETRLVIELDGGQHFANEDAYRRDRRKDALLQEHGYFVLRFLVQDIGIKLDIVLDTIFPALAHLRKYSGRC